MRRSAPTPGGLPCVIEQAAIARRSSRADVADEAMDVIAKDFREPTQAFRRAKHFASSDAGRFARHGDSRNRTDAGKPQLRLAGCEKGERGSSLRLDGGHDRDRTCDPYHVKVVL